MNVSITEPTQLADELSLIADRVEDKEDALLFRYRSLIRSVSSAIRQGMYPDEISFVAPEEHYERHHGWHKNYHRPGPTRAGGD